MKFTNEYLLRSTSDGIRLSSLHSMGLPMRCVLRYFRMETNKQKNKEANRIIIIMMK